MSGLGRIQCSRFKVEFPLNHLNLFNFLNLTISHFTENTFHFIIHSLFPVFPVVDLN